MAYLSPSTERTEHACEKCKHFGGWPEREFGTAWCLKTLYGNALSYAGCCSWTPQPEGWVAPPDPGPTPGLAIYGNGRPSGARIR
jgi:hypothetical protein